VNSTSYGGTDIENDENLRERIQIAPEYFSVAGPRGAYEYWARTAHQLITNVSVVSPEPGLVEIYPLLAGGELPTQEILNTVYDICNAEDIRPLTDFVQVLMPQEITYELNVTYWVDKANATLAGALKTAVENAVESFVAWQKAVLGRDINPSELVHRMIAAGAKRVEVISPVFTVLSESNVARPSSVSVTFGGLENA
jgi:phage-related baseplate assembly protein